MSLRVFFGGSFAPPHVGHHQILSRLTQEPNVERVHVVPTGVNPLKKSDEHFSDFERGLLVDAWMEDFKRIDREAAQKVVLEKFELESGKVSYTVDSLNRLKEEHPGAKWVLAIGADLLNQLSQWKSIVDLLASIDSVWVFKRGGYELGPKEVPQELRSLCTWRWFPEVVQWISSTELRELDMKSDATQAKLRPYLLDNVYEVVSRLLQQKNQA